MRKAMLIGACVAAVAGSGCEGGSPEAQMVTVRARDAGGALMPDLQVTVWVVDGDLAVEEREAVEMEPLTTDSRGQATWVVDDMIEPYVCGYRVIGSAGGELLYAAPDVRERRSTPDGIVNLIL